MICRNCGFHNAEGDEFCGSCGQFLEWGGEAAAGESAQGTAATAGTAAMSGVGAGSAAASPSPPPPPQPWPDPQPAASFPAPATLPPADGASGGQSFGGLDVICWNCSRRNPASRSFCQQCGERLTTGAATRPVGGAGVAGVAGVQAARSGGGNRSLVLAGGGLLLLLLVGGTAFLLFGGTPASPVPTPFGPSRSPGLSGIAGSASPSSSGASPGSFEPSPTVAGTSSAPPSGEPTALPTATSEPTQPPTAPPTAKPSGVEVGRFNCDAQSVRDGSPTRWKILGTWLVQQTGSYDRLVLTIVRTPTKAPDMAVISARIVPANKVQSMFGVPNPKRGDKALVVTLPPPIVFGGVLENDKDRPAIEGFRVTGKGSGNTYAVLGLNAASCYDVSAPQWGPGIDPPDESFIWIDVRRP